MYTLHCTKKLLDRIKHPVAPPAPEPSTKLGNWYATAVFWQPQIVLAVNERTLLPVVLPLAPATTVADRLPVALADVLRGIGIPEALITDELAAMNHAVTATWKRSELAGKVRSGSGLDSVDANDPLSSLLTDGGLPSGLPGHVETLSGLIHS